MDLEEIDSEFELYKRKKMRRFKSNKEKKNKSKLKRNEH